VADSSQTPFDYFNSRYGYEVIEQKFRNKPRQDPSPNPFPNDLIVKDSQQLCDEVAKHIKSLLNPNEMALLGDFYFGLTDRPYISSSIDPVGESYLIVIHRRLFNALQYISDVIPSSSIQDIEKKLIIIKYVSMISESTDHLTQLPDNILYRSPDEMIVSTGFNCGLLRYVLCHELSHVVPPELSSISQLIEICNGTTAEIPLRPKWQKELRADFFGVCLPMRENRLDGFLKESYIQSTLLTAILFHRLFYLVEHYGNVHHEDHPPSELRAHILHLKLMKAFPQYENDIRDIYNEACLAFDLNITV
jgi:hypothetical protein